MRVITPKNTRQTYKYTSRMRKPWGSPSRVYWACKEGSGNLVDNKSTIHINRALQQAVIITYF